MVKLTTAQDQVIKPLASGKSIRSCLAGWTVPGENVLISRDRVSVLRQEGLVDARQSGMWFWLSLTPAGIEYAKSKGWLKDGSV
jgi:hypothetical protein